MVSDAAKSAQILRGHEERIRQLEESENPDQPANLIAVSEEDSRLWDDVSTSTTSTTATKWDSSDWSGSNDATTDMNWS